MIWTDSYLNTVIEQAEKDVSRERNCLFYRFSLSVVSGTATYTLPDGIIGIQRVTWKGKEVDPDERMGMEDTSYWKPNSTGSQSRPLFYLRDGYGYKTIEFFPVPNETIAADDTIVYGSGIASLVIISAWRQADPANGLNIPDWNRRNLIKYYTMHKAFLKEGKGQNLVAADYCFKKFTAELETYKTIHDNLYLANKKVLQPQNLDSRQRPARPVLPSGSKWSF